MKPIVIDSTGLKFFGTGEWAADRNCLAPQNCQLQHDARQACVCPHPLTPSQSDRHLR
jgi:hypothetical protein